MAKLGAALAAAAILVIAGCKSVDLKGDGFHDDMARWGEKQRPPDQPQEGDSEMLGVSASRSRSSGISACGNLFDRGGMYFTHDAGRQHRVASGQRGAILQQLVLSRVRAAKRLCN